MLFKVADCRASLLTQHAVHRHIGIGDVDQSLLDFRNKFAIDGFKRCVLRRCRNRRRFGIFRLSDSSRHRINRDTLTASIFAGALFRNCGDR
ncbi:hypothetical protein D3C80_1617150 [compost metagenome]